MRYRLVASFFISLVLLITSAQQSRATDYAPLGSTPDSFGAIGSCSLRDAIYAATHNLPSGGCAAGSATATDIITLQAGAVYRLTRVGSDDTGVSGDLDIVGSDSSADLDLIIRTDNNNTASIMQTVEGERVLDILNGAAVMLDNVIISGGSGVSGAGIRQLGSALTLKAVTVINNHVGVTGSGGGLLVADSGTATITGSRFIENSATSGYGGAIFATSPVTIDSTLFRQNGAINGGALAINSTTGTLTNSTFVQNEGGYVGGGFASGGDVAALNNATVSINNSTFVGSAAYNGGAPAAALIAQSSTLTVRNSIISPNSGSLPCVAAPTNTISATYNRLSALGTPCDGTASALITAAALTALGDYGGTAETILLRADSNALDAGDPLTCTTRDARGALRRQTLGRCDIGAVEMLRLLVTPPDNPVESTFPEYVLRLSPHPPAELSVAVLIKQHAGSATENEDYRPIYNVFVFDSVLPEQALIIQHIDDRIDEPDESYSLSFTLLGSVLLPVETINGIIIDDDTAGTALSPTSLTLTKGGATQPVTLALTSQPTAAVTVTLTLDAAEFTAAETTQTITPAAWATGATFNIAANPTVLTTRTANVITVTTTSADPLYNNRSLTLPVTVLETDTNIVANSDFEHDHSGGTAANDKQALAWKAAPKASGQNRRVCKASGHASACAWVFKGGAAVQKIKQPLTLVPYTSGDVLVLSGSARRVRLVGKATAQVVMKMTDGTKHKLKIKFTAGKDAAYVSFGGHLLLDMPPSNISSVMLTLSSSATGGKIFFDALAVYVQPAASRDETLPPPPLPPEMRSLD